MTRLQCRLHWGMELLTAAVMPVVNEVLDNTFQARAAMNAA